MATWRDVKRLALVAEDPTVFFTTPHFDGYPSVLIKLPEIGIELLEEVVTEAWLAVAPDRLAREFLAERGDP